MKELFLEPIKFEKIAKTILKPDAATWSKEILSEFYETFPYLMNYPVHLQFKKKDERQGYALGSIQLQHVSVPVIVENYELHPFDVAYINGAPVPFTAETVATVFSNPTAYAQLEKYEYNDVTSPLFGQGRGLREPEPHYKHSSVMLDRAYDESMLDKLGSCISRVARDELLQRVGFDEAVSTGFMVNETQEVIDKLAAVKPMSERDYTSGVRHSLDRNLCQITKLAEDDYRIRLGNSLVHDPVELRVTEEQASKFQAGFHKLAESYEKIAAFVPMGESLHDSAQHHVVNVGDRVFVVEKRNADFKYFEVPARYRKQFKFKDDGLSKLSSFEEQYRPAVGDTGFLKVGEQYLGPLSVTQIHRDGDKVTDFEASAELTKKAYVYLKGIDTLLPHQDIPNTIYIPDSSQFMKMSGMLSYESFKTDTRTHNIVANGDNTYTLRGPKFDKYAEKYELSLNSLDSPDTRWHLMQCGVNAEDIALEKIGRFAPLKLDEVTVPISAEELSAAIKLGFSRDIEDARRIAIDLVKEASVIPDKTTVDAVLSLGVLSSDNVLEFIEQVPLLENVASYLAKLLISSRLGLRVVPEKAVKKAMEGIAIIIETLRAVEAIRKPVK